MLILVIAALTLAVVAFAIAIQNLKAPRLGISQGRFAPCGTAPNCVSSQSTRSEKRIDPFPGHPEGIEIIAEIIESMPHARIVTKDGRYLHAIFSSPIFGFRDDMEFYRNDESKWIDVRSAARTGYYDFNVNRKRVEGIREEYLKRTRQGSYQESGFSALKL